MGERACGRASGARATGFGDGAVLGGAAGHAEVVDGGGVEREEAGGRAVLGGHVRDDGAVGEREGGAARAEEFDELADDVVGAQEARDGQGEVGGRGAGGQGAEELDAGDDGGYEGDGLAEHGGFGLDAADAPAEDAEAVDHGGVGVGADEGVGEGEEGAVGGGLGADGGGEELEVDLVADADARGDDAELLEGVLAPAEEFVALAVAAEFDGDVVGEGVGGACAVDLDRVVDDHVDGDEGLDERRVGAGADAGGAEAGEVDDAGDAGEVLEEDAGGEVGDFLGGGGVGLPAGEGLDVLPLVGGVGLVAKGGLEEDADDEGEFLDGGAAEGGEGGDVVVGDGFSAGGKGGEGGLGLGGGAHRSAPGVDDARSLRDGGRRGKWRVEENTLPLCGKVAETRFHCVEKCGKQGSIAWKGREAAQRPRARPEGRKWAKRPMFTEKSREISAAKKAGE